uniref:ATP synthase complex subunit 8 n=1 Tax=Rhysodes sp. BMNH-844233 TaxID=1909167 RepID=A0A343A4C1_9CARA|nr:ATP synthase F0 subunit 8 [Rhysodes sp. BMNH-844233]
MPQMSPLMWSLLFMMFLFIFLMFYFINFYQHNIKNFKKKSLINLSFKSSNWKW